MGNGWPPPRILTDEDYQVVKNGVCISTGGYAGCIMTGSRPNFTFHWFEPDGTYWKRQTGTPGANQCAVTDEIWDQCKNGGTLDWNSGGEYWEDDTDNYRWAADAGYDLQLKKI